MNEKNAPETFEQAMDDADFAVGWDDACADWDADMAEEWDGPGMGKF